MVLTKLLLENALSIRPCNYKAALEPLLLKVARCIPVLSSRYVGKRAGRTSSLNERMCIKREAHHHKIGGTVFINGRMCIKWEAHLHKMEGCAKDGKYIFIKWDGMHKMGGRCSLNGRILINGMQ